MVGEVELQLRNHDPRERIKVTEGGIVLGMALCICSTEAKDISKVWREEKPEWFNWLGEAMLATIDHDGTRRITVRQLQPFYSGRISLPDWMPAMPGESVDLPNGVDTSVGRALVWKHPELYDYIPRRPVGCLACGFGNWDSPPDAWDEIIHKCGGDWGNLLGSQHAVIEPDSGLGHTLMLIRERAKREGIEHARKGRVDSACAHCGTKGIKGNVTRAEREAGVVAIQDEHGIPNARWPEFYGHEWTPKEDVSRLDNLWNSCESCNNNKGTQTLSEYRKLGGFTFKTTADWETIQRVLDFEKHARENPPRSRRAK